MHRILDANINRAKEGLRVCEEIARFVLDHPGLTQGFKKIRHEMDAAVRGLPGAPLALLRQRNSPADVGRKIHAYELKRKNFSDIFYANIQRVKESARVLEEFSKLLSAKAALRFKKIRYGVYEIEKKASRYHDSTGIR